MFAFNEVGRPATNWSSLTKRVKDGQRFYFPITATTIELVSIFKMYFVFSNKKI
jgi:hypothetical protein